MAAGPQSWISVTTTSAASRAARARTACIPVREDSAHGQSTQNARTQGRTVQQGKKKQLQVKHGQSPKTTDIGRQTYVYCNLLYDCIVALLAMSSSGIDQHTHWQTARTTYGPWPYAKSMRCPICGHHTRSTLTTAASVSRAHVLFASPWCRRCLPSSEHRRSTRSTARPHRHRSAARAARRVPTGTGPQHAQHGASPPAPVRSTTHTAANGTRAMLLLQRLRAETSRAARTMRWCYHPARVLSGHVHKYRGSDR